MKKFLFIMFLGYLFFTFPQILSAKERLPEELKNEIEEKRSPFFTEAAQSELKQFRKYLTENLDKKEDKKIAKKLALSGEIKTVQENKKISLKEAKQDIDFCFSYLRYQYAGYQYFGGDKNFLKAKQEIKKEISNQKKETITTKKLEKIFIKYTKDFLHDSHFSVGNTGMYKFFAENLYYSNDDLLFEKRQDKNYYTTIDKKIYRLLKINENSAESYLHMTLNSEGYIAYAIGINRTEKEFTKEKEVILTLQEIQNLTIIEKKLNLKINYRSYFPYPPYNRLEKEGICLIENRSMAAENKEQQEQLEAFMKEANSLQKCNTFILDLRGNGGGSDIYPSTWLKNYASLSYFPENNVISSSLNTYTSNQKLLMDLASTYNITEQNRLITSLEQSLDIAKNIDKEFIPKWSDIEYLESIKKIKNDNIIFVLIDGGTVSSGESFVAFLHQMENVIFVGTRTAGMYTIANNSSIALPNSNLKIFCGNTLFLPPNLQSIEGKGFSPDLWITPEAGEGDIFEDICVERILKFIKNYDLN